MGGLPPRKQTNHITGSGGEGGGEEEQAPPPGNRRPLIAMITENGLQTAKTCLDHKHQRGPDRPWGPVPRPNPSLVA